MRNRRDRAPVLAGLALAAASAVILAGCGGAPASAHSSGNAAAASTEHPQAARATSAAPASATKAPAPAAPKVLLSLSGSGIANSAPFLVTTGSLTVDYSYNCASFGSSGNFIADLLSGNQADPGSDDQSIANALGSGGSATTTIYPQNTGSDYHLAVNSECDWNVVVWSGVVRQTPSTPAAAPPSAPTVTDPWAVVSAFYADITSKDYAGAWSLLGFDPNGASYAAFVAGYADTGGQTVTETSESGDQVSFNLTSNNPDGTVQTYSGTDTVQNGRIVAANVVQTG